MESVSASEEALAEPGGIGRIQRVPLREVWRHEALDFTTWLELNADVLGEVLDITLDNMERERSAGAFSVDLVAEDEAGNPVVIENQLEKSNHDHLGKLITYPTAVEARTAIWIVSDPRPEHVRAIAWLNSSNAADYYLLKVEALRIGDSPAAPLFTLIVGPSEETRQAGAAKQHIAERYDLRQAFWTGLLAREREATRLHASVSPGRYSWIGAGAGKGGLRFDYTIRQHEAVVELYIDRGRDAGDENLAIFDHLHARKTAIEDAFGGPLEWRRLEEKRACRVCKTINLGGYRDPEVRWPAIQDAMVDSMVRLERALRPEIDALPAH